MCTVSAVGDNYRDQFPQKWPAIQPWFQPAGPVAPGPVIIGPQITRQEFDDLRKEVQELRELLKAAKKFDEQTGQKDCEVDEKVAFIKKLAEFVGVDMTEIFGKN